MSEIYVKAGEIIGNVIKGRSFKKITNGVKNKVVVKLSCNTLKYIFILNDMFNELKLTKKFNKKSIFTAVVMVYDLCFGSGKISGGGIIKKKIISNKNAIKTWLVRLKLAKNVVCDENLLDGDIVNYEKRIIYARINEIKNFDKNKIIFTLNSIKESKEWNIMLKKNSNELFSFYLDDFVPSLICFNFEFFKLVKNNSKLFFDNNLIIQDKSSCFPILSLIKENLFENKNFDIIDACAAPGSKTLQLASFLTNQNGKNLLKINQNGENLLKNNQNGENLSKNNQNGENLIKNDKNGENLSKNDKNGENLSKNDQNGENLSKNDQNCQNLIKNDQNDENLSKNDQNCENLSKNDQNGKNLKIFAFEKNKSRFLTLKKRINENNFQKIVQVENCDFLDVDFNSEFYKNVEIIILDPSCSGTGTLSRNIDQWVNFKRKKKDFIEKETKYYSKLQKNLICHSFKFPSVKIVIYSTCSINSEENEKVVNSILKSHNFVKLRKILPNWPCRGFSQFPNHEKMVRTNSAKHKTSGFFVACFEITKKSKNCDCAIEKNNFDFIKQNLKDRINLFGKF